MRPVLPVLCCVLLSLSACKKDDEATGSDGPQTLLTVGLLAAIAGLVLLMTRRAGRKRRTT